MFCFDMLLGQNLFQKVSLVFPLQFRRKWSILLTDTDQTCLVKSSSALSKLLSKRNFTSFPWVMVFAGMLFMSCQAIPEDKSQSPESHPHSYVLEAPQNIDRWEPSAAIVIGDLLWVANDKPVKARDRTWGVLAAYDLTVVQTWQQLRTTCSKSKNDLMKGKCDGNEPVNVGFISGANKIEAGGALRGDGIWWDTYENKSVICKGKMQDSCSFHKLSGPNDEDLRKLVEVEAHAFLNDKGYVTTEGLAFIAGQNWVGVRKYKKNFEADEVYWTAIVDDKGDLVWGGGNLELSGKPFAISDLSADQNDGVWVTLSYEKIEKPNDKKEDVDGRLAWIKLSENGRFESMHLCMDAADENRPLVLAGKPEGVAVYGKKLVIVYDNDNNRKEGQVKNGTGFPIRSNQDYLELIPKPNCSSGSELYTNDQKL